MLYTSEIITLQASAGNCKSAGRFFAPLCFNTTTMAKRLSNAADYNAFIDAYDTWLFDCDGVLLHGDRLIDGAIDILNLLRQKRA